MAAENVKPFANKRFLILTSYGPGHPGPEAMAQGFQSMLMQNGISIDQVFREDLDLGRFKEESVRRSRVEYLHLKYKSLLPDVLLIISPPALNFFLQDLNDISPRALVITLNQGSLPQIKNTNHYFINSALLFDIEGTLRLALALFPRTRKALFVAGATDGQQRHVDPGPHRHETLGRPGEI